jgi:predicted transcriptional regulator YdeE
MKVAKLKLDAMTIVGLGMRTNSEGMSQENSSIIALMNKYHDRKVADRIKNRSHPGVTFAVYTEYEDNFVGSCNYIIGEVVASLGDQDLEQLQAITIPSSCYLRFTTDAGLLPDVVIKAWEEIASFSEIEMQHRRKYLADFEVYDNRAANSNNAQVDIYIGIEP